MDLDFLSLRLTNFDVKAKNNSKRADKTNYWYL